jgi:uncharacterized membrane protein
VGPDLPATSAGVSDDDLVEASPWVDLPRLISLSDGIFAFAMTLLVIELVVPIPKPLLQGAALEGFLGASLRGDAFEFLGYAFAFTMIAIWWVSHQRLFLRLKRADPRFQWMNLAFLMTVSVTPFVLGLLVSPNASGTLLGAGVFLATEAATSLLLSGMWFYATDGHRLVDPGMSRAAIERQRAVTLTRSGIFVAAVGLAFLNPSWGLDSLILIYVLQAVQTRRRRRRKPEPPAFGTVAGGPNGPTRPPG